ncbi:DNA-binding protein [Bacteroidia bacterium]|nr:DNA-binding protein [Bacteroidia bacterium]
MYVHDDFFTTWMEKLSKKLNEMGKDLKSLVQTKEIFENGEKPLDNQDLCLMLHISPRTLQRYRSEGLLPFFKHGQKIYYKTADVRAFVYKNGDHWDKKAFDDTAKAKDEE